MRYLSMGMSGDFEWAIAEGSTLLRLGTALFRPAATIDRPLLKHVAEGTRLKQYGKSDTRVRPRRFLERRKRVLGIIISACLEVYSIVDPRNPGGGVLAQPRPLQPDRADPAQPHRPAPGLGCASRLPQLHVFLRAFDFTPIVIIPAGAAGADPRCSAASTSEWPV